MSTLHRPRLALAVAAAAVVTASARLPAAAAAAAANVNLTASADAGVLSDFPDFAAGGGSTGSSVWQWWVPVRRAMYVRFDLSGVDVADVTAATLTLTRADGNGGTPLTAVWGYNDGGARENWDEATLTYNTRFALVTAGQGPDDATRDLGQTSDLGTLSSAGTAAGSAYSLGGAGLTAFLRSQVGADDSVTFVLQAVHAAGQDAWNFRDFATRESAAFAAPTLSLTVVPEPGSAAGAGAVVAAAALARRSRRRRGAAATATPPSCSR